MDIAGALVPSTTKPRSFARVSGYVVRICAAIDRFPGDLDRNVNFELVGLTGGPNLISELHNRFHSSSL